MLHANIGIFEIPAVISKKVTQLYDGESIGIAIGFWEETLTKHLRTHGKNELAAKLVKEFFDFRRALDRFQLLTTFKQSTAGLFDDSVIEWCQSNTDLALRKPLNQIAHDKVSSHLITANAIYEKQRAAKAKEEKEKETKRASNNYSNRYQFATARFTSNYRPQPRFAETTPDGKTVCRNFNRGRCVGDCKYEHICNICLRGKHPGIKCFNRNNSNSTTTATTTTAKNKD